jgi:hypothetical protein
MGDEAYGYMSAAPNPYGGYGSYQPPPQQPQYGGYDNARNSRYPPSNGGDRGGRSHSRGSDYAGGMTPRRDDNGRGGRGRGGGGDRGRGRGGRGGGGDRGRGGRGGRGRGGRGGGDRGGRGGRRMEVDLPPPKTQYPRANNRFDAKLISASRMTRDLQTKNFTVVPAARQALADDLRKLLSSTEASTFTKGCNLVGAIGEQGFKFGYSKAEYAGVAAHDSTSCFVMEQALLDQLEEDLDGDVRVQSAVFVKKAALQLIPSGYVCIYGRKEEVENLEAQAMTNYGVIFHAPVDQLQDGTLMQTLYGFYQLSLRRRALGDKIRPIAEFREDEGFVRIKSILQFVRFPENSQILLCVSPESGNFDLIGRARRLGDEPHTSARRALELYYGLLLPVKRGPPIRLTDTSIGYLHNTSFYFIHDASFDEEARVALNYRPPRPVRPNRHNRNKGSDGEQSELMVTTVESTSMMLDTSN